MILQMDSPYCICPIGAPKSFRPSEVQEICIPLGVFIWCTVSRVFIRNHDIDYRLLRIPL